MGNVLCFKMCQNDFFFYKQTGLQIKRLNLDFSLHLLHIVVRLSSMCIKVMNTFLERKKQNYRYLWSNIESKSTSLVICSSSLSVCSIKSVVQILLIIAQLICFYTVYKIRSRTGFLFFNLLNLNFEDNLTLLPLQKKKPELTMTEQWRPSLQYVLLIM